MPEIKPETHAFLKDLFESYLDDVLDDPSHMIHPDETMSPQEAVAELKAVGDDLGCDWDAILAKATPYDRERLLAYGRGETDLGPLQRRLIGRWRD